MLMSMPIGEAAHRVADRVGQAVRIARRNQPAPASVLQNVALSAAVGGDRRHAGRQRFHQYAWQSFRQARCVNEQVGVGVIGGDSLRRNRADDLDAQALGFEPTGEPR